MKDKTRGGRFVRVTRAALRHSFLLHERGVFFPLSLVSFVKGGVKGWGGNRKGGYLGIGIGIGIGIGKRGICIFFGSGKVGKMDGWDERRGGKGGNIPYFLLFRGLQWLVGGWGGGGRIGIGKIITQFQTIFSD